MKKFIELMEKYVVPVAAKIGGERHLAAIRDGFVSIIPIIMAGATAILINNFSPEIYQHMMKSVFGPGWKDWGGFVWNASYAIMSMLVTFTIAYHLTRSRNKDGLAAGIAAVGTFIVFLGVLDTTTVGFFGTNGLLLAIVIALIVGDLMSLLLGNPKLVIKMPAGVPPAVAKSFASLFPTMIVIFGAGALQEIYSIFTKTNLPQLVNTWIQTPLQGVVGSFWGMIALILVIQFLWFFGLHGSNMMFPIVQGVLFPLTIANMHSIELGQAPKYIINDQFLNSFCNMGGSGLTICLIGAIFIVNRFGRKSEIQLAISKIAAGPAIFNINEPIIFGLPICLDPIYFIPFIFAPIVNAIITYNLMVWHVVPYPTLEVTWTMPPILSAYFGTNSWQGAVLAAVLLVLDVLIYLPFVIVARDRDIKVMDARVAEENLETAQKAN